MAIISRAFAGRRSAAEARLANTSRLIFPSYRQDQPHTFPSIAGNLRSTTAVTF